MAGHLPMIIVHRARHLTKFLKCPGIYTREGGGGEELVAGNDSCHNGVIQSWVKFR